MVGTMLKLIVWLHWVLLAFVWTAYVRVRQGNSSDNIIQIQFTDDQFLDLYNCLCQWRHCAVELKRIQGSVMAKKMTEKSAYCGAYLGYSVCHHNTHNDQLLCNMKSSNISTNGHRSCLSNSGGICACVGFEWVFSGETILKPTFYNLTCGGFCNTLDPTDTVSPDHVNKETSSLTSCNLTSASSEPDSKIDHTTLIVVVSVSVLSTAAISILGVFFYRRRRSRSVSKITTSEICSRKPKPELLADNDSLINSVEASPSTEEMKYYPKLQIKKVYDNSTDITSSYEPVDDLSTKQYSRAKRRYEVIETDIQTIGSSCTYTEIDLTSRPLKLKDKVRSSTGELETGYEYVDDRDNLPELLHRPDGSDLNGDRNTRKRETDDSYYESVSIKMDVRPAVVVQVEREYAHVPSREHPTEQLGVLGEVEESSYMSSPYSKLREVTLDNLNPYDHLNQD